ncbi:response regulator [Synechococcus sp. PCC 7502]|uniref:response regulator n=1 Tax=Synechococcus sp. PCC 7502 TaxID=1173263 RepID=UPI0002DBC5E6|nr:response regulator [Synechococcus sp. PCC 7502]
MKSSSVQERSLVVVIAESDYSTSQLVVAELRKDRHLVIVRDNFEDIDVALSIQIPDLLILGNVQGVRFLDSLRKYSKLHPNMRIILLTGDEKVNQTFRNWAISKGFYDVLSSYYSNLHLLREALQEILYSYQNNPQEIPEFNTSISDLVIPELPLDLNLETNLTLETLSYRQTLYALNQITQFSKQYFNEMILANYWNKSYRSLIVEHHWLESWSINHNGTISYFSEEIPEGRLTESEYASLKLWVQGFLQECDRLINDYTSILQKAKLSVPVNQIIGFIS